jgi:hypothetical protein
MEAGILANSGISVEAFSVLYVHFSKRSLNNSFDMTMHNATWYSSIYFRQIQ